MSTKKLIVVGGGAAGFFCAINAARLNPNLEVILLEKTKRLLSKVRISGGGRCNVTYACFDISEMSKNYPRGSQFVKRAFYKFFTNDTVGWFEERQVELKTEKDGRMFPVSDSSQTIIDCLLREANRYKVQIRMNAEVTNVESKNEKLIITINNREKILGDFVCISSGGYPKSAMFNWISDMGHSIEEPAPSLFTFNIPTDPVKKLMGVSVAEVRIKILGSKLQQEGALLITHWGFSGPAVLRLSAWGARELAERNYQFDISVNWVKESNEQSLQTQLQNVRTEYASKKTISKSAFGLPQSLWEYLLIRSGIDPESRWADLSNKNFNRLIKNLYACEFEVKGKTTFKEEFVTAGGIKLSEVDPQTMMSKKIKGLYLAGEVLDVDGITGGYNFQHAWTSGFIAASCIAASV